MNEQLNELITKIATSGLEGSEAFIGELGVWKFQAIRQPGDHAAPYALQFQLVQPTAEGEVYFSKGDPLVFLTSTLKIKDEFVTVTVNLYVNADKRSTVTIQLGEYADINVDNFLVDKYFRYMEEFIPVYESQIRSWGRAWLKIDEAKPAQALTDDVYNTPLANIQPTTTKLVSFEPQIKHVESFSAALQSNNENRILAAVKRNLHITPDEILDLYQKAKELKSNKLMNLVKQMNLKESVARFERYYKNTER